MTEYEYEWLTLENGEKRDFVLEKIEIVDKGQPHGQPIKPQWALGRFHRHYLIDESGKKYIFDRRIDTGFVKKVEEIVKAQGTLPCEIRIYRLPAKGWYLAQFPPELEEELRTPDFVKEL